MRRAQNNPGKVFFPSPYAGTQSGTALVSNAGVEPFSLPTGYRLRGQAPNRLYRHLSALLLLLLCCCSASFARNYFLSPAGNDKATGKTPATAWRSLQRLQKVQLSAGDTVFLQRGGVFRGSIQILQSGTTQKPIVLMAYGTGAEPVISGAVATGNLKEIDNNRFEATVTQRVYDVFQEEKRLIPARYPNSGFLTIEKGHGKDSIECSKLQEPHGFWNGATLRLRSIDWVYETRAVQSYQRGLLIQGPQDRYLLEKSFEQRTQGGRTGIYNFQKGYGFYLEGLPGMVDTAGEWSWKGGKLLLQLPEGELPGERIEAVVQPYGVWIGGGVQHVVIKDISFTRQEKAGIGGGPHIRHLTVSNSLFNNIHGAGIWLDSASSEVRIVNNQFSDILGRGLSLLETSGSEVTGNSVRRIGLSRGHGWSGVNGATGILLHNTERKISFDTTFAHHNVVRNNRVDSCGYNGIRVDGHHNLVEYNVIDHCSLTLNDGANLYCFAAAPNVTHHSVFRNNIVRYSIGDSEATPGNPNLAFGIYIDNNSHDMVVEGNTVISTGAAGIVNNDASFNNTFQNNTVFDCQEGLGFSEWANPGKLFGLVVKGNTVVAIKPKQWAVSMTNWLGPKLDVGLLQNNRYINTTSTNFFYYTTRQFPEATRLALSFEQYQRITANEQGSGVVSAATDWAKNLQPGIVVNESSEGKQITVTGDWWSVTGEKGPSVLHLSPFSSQILMKQKNTF